MDVVETFGKIVDRECDKDPARGRRVLRAGWEAQLFRFRHMPVKALMPAYQYLAALMMDTMLKPLRDPGHSAVVSIFTPSQPPGGGAVAVQRRGLFRLSPGIQMRAQLHPHRRGRRPSGDTVFLP